MARPRSTRSCSAGRFNLTHRDWRGDQPIGGPREVQVARQMGPSWRLERELHQRFRVGGTEDWGHDVAIEVAMAYRVL